MTNQVKPNARSALGSESGFNGLFLSFSSSVTQAALRNWKPDSPKAAHGFLEKRTEARYFIALFLARMPCWGNDK